MGRNPRHLLQPGGLVEVTLRTVHSRFLLRPGRELNRIVAGCLGKALELYPVRLHAVVFMSSHAHLLLSPEDSKQLADFMCHLKTNISKKVGKLHDWPGPMFDRRYQCIEVSGEPAAQQERLRYLLSQGCKEGLVATPRDWPGIQSASTLCDGLPIRGTWIDLTAYWNARNRGECVDPSQFGTDYAIDLAPLPCWRHLDERVWRGYVRDMVLDIAGETRALHRRLRTTPLGVKSLLGRSPHYRPEKIERSPAPLVHAATRRVRLEMIAALRDFVVAYRAAADLLRRGVIGALFPPDSFPPRRPYVPSG